MNKTSNILDLRNYKEIITKQKPFIKKQLEKFHIVNLISSFIGRLNLAASD